MSYLSRPRLGFFADDAMTNPSTANNENVIHLLDYDNVELLNPPVVKGATLPAMDPAAYREWMTRLLTYADPLDQQADPSRPDWHPGIPGYWNYWGDHLTTFGSAKLTSIWVDNEPVTAPGTDPLYGARVAFNARIVDLNPADTFSTQFVAAGLGVIGPDANGDTVELVRGVPTTSVTRWLNFWRPGGAGTFQAVIPKDALEFIDAARAPKSAGLQALRDGAAQGGGLLLRWCFYGMAAATGMPEMYDRFQQGERAMNPKVGRVVGSIGVWNGQDPFSAPVGRMLHQPGAPYFSPANDERKDARSSLRVKTHEDVERIATPGTHLHAQSAEATWAAKMGPAAAHVEVDRVVLDLSTAFPEGDKADGHWAKHDFGTVRLELVPADGGQPVKLGDVAYDATTYERLGGVVEVAFDQDLVPHVHDGWLRLVDEAGTVLLREIEIAQVITDDQAVYLDFADDGHVGADKVVVRVFLKGEPIATATTLRVELWEDVQEPGQANSVNPLVVTATEIGEQRVQTRSIHVTAAANGRVDVPINSTGSSDSIDIEKAGCYKLRYVPPGMVGESPPNWAVEYFSCVRVLPYDDYRHVPDEELTLDFVYREVLHYYAILYPIMSTIIPWGPANTPHDPERVGQFATLMLQAVDESRLGTALQMPITRELSAGKRALLQRWCKLQLRT